MGQLGDLSPQGSVAVGIFVGLASTSVQSIGLTLQRKSHILEDEKEPHSPRRPPFRRRRWQLGMLMFVVSNLLGSTIQITTLPLPVLSTLQASGLVFNSICATLILGEPFTRWSLGGTILVCIGAVLIAIFGAIAEPAHNLSQLLMLLGRQQFLIWMLITAILVIAIIVSAKAIKYLNPWTSNSPRLRLLRGMAYGGISGILSAHSLLVAKSAVELLVRTIVDRHNQFNRWQSWVILLGLLGLALSQLYYLHRGLKLCSTSILYPFVFCVYNIIAILDGLIYFHQTSRLSLLHALLIALGTVILLTGVLALSWRLNYNNNDPSTRPAVAQTPLTPGMGFINDAEESDFEPETDRLLDPFAAVDEETAAATTPNGKAFSPLLKTPTSRNNDLLSVTRARRKGMLTETEEILEELEDDAVGELSPFSHRRVSSVRSTPSRGVRMDGEEGAPRPPLPPATASESTALLERRGTGRSYRDVGRGGRRRRRRSAALSVGEGSRWQQQGRQRWWEREWWRGREKKRRGGGEDEERGGGGTE